MEQLCFCFEEGKTQTEPVKQVKKLEDLPIVIIKSEYDKKALAAILAEHIYKDIKHERKMARSLHESKLNGAGTI